MLQNTEQLRHEHEGQLRQELQESLKEAADLKSRFEVEKAELRQALMAQQRERLRQAVEDAQGRADAEIHAACEKMEAELRSDLERSRQEEVAKVSEAGRAQVAKMETERGFLENEVQRLQESLASDVRRFSQAAEVEEGLMKDLRAARADVGRLQAELSFLCCNKVKLSSCKRRMIHAKSMRICLLPIASPSPPHLPSSHPPSHPPPTSPAPPTSPPLPPSQPSQPS